MDKVKKIYKIDDKVTANKGRKKKGAQETVVPSGIGKIDDRKELEVIVLGLMALRGQS